MRWKEAFTYSRSTGYFCSVAASTLRVSGSSKHPGPPSARCDGPGLVRALHRAEDIGSALKGGVNVCQRQLVNEVLGPLAIEFAYNLGREGTTPIGSMPAAKWGVLWPHGLD
jgi:hypothetical protein